MENVIRRNFRWTYFPLVCRVVGCLFFFFAFLVKMVWVGLMHTKGTAIFVTRDDHPFFISMTWESMMHWLRDWLIPQPHLDRLIFSI